MTSSDNTKTAEAEAGEEEGNEVAQAIRNAKKRQQQLASAKTNDGAKVTSGAPAAEDHASPNTEHKGVQRVTVKSSTREMEQLVGFLGRERITKVLSTSAPSQAIEDIHKATLICDKRCAPLLDLIYQLGLGRSEVNKSILDFVIKVLLRRIPQLSQESLSQLLEVSFQYISFPELRAIPVAVLEHLFESKTYYLKQLSKDPKVFAELPISVQRQVWEIDKHALRKMAVPLVSAFALETATELTCLNMDCENPNRHFNFGAMAVPSVSRQTYRQGSAALKKAGHMIGKSWKVYREVVAICVGIYREGAGTPFATKDVTAHCAFRSQLLMCLHDAMSGLRKQDPCYDLAWALEAAVKARSLSAEGRLNKIAQQLAPYDPDQGGGGPGGREGSKRGKKRRKGAAEGGLGGELDPGGNSTSQPDERSVVLGEMGMVLRDPPVFYLLAREAVAHLEECVTQQDMPRHDPHLVLLTRLLQVALDSREMLRERSYVFRRAHADATRDLYPRLMAVICQARALAVEHGARKGVKIRVEGEEDGEAKGGAAKEGDPPPPVFAGDEQAHLVRWLSHSGLAQVVTQTYCLELLSRAKKVDLWVANALLGAMAQAAAGVASKALAEWTPFAYTLSERMQSMVAGGKQVRPGAAIWVTAFEGVLLPCLDAEILVLESVLRLLEVAQAYMDASELARHLELTLVHSHKSRRRFKRKKVRRRAVVAHDRDAMASGALSSQAGDLGASTTDFGSLVDLGLTSASEGHLGPGNRGGDDGVHSVYAKLAGKIGAGLTEEAAPELFAYVAANQGGAPKAE